MKFIASKLLPMTVILAAVVAGFAFWGPGDKDPGIIDPMTEVPAAPAADRDKFEEAARSQVGAMVGEVKSGIKVLEAAQQEQGEINRKVLDELQQIGKKLRQRSDGLGRRGQQIIDRMEHRLGVLRNDLERVARQRSLSPGREKSGPVKDPYAIEWTYPAGYVLDARTGELPGLTGFPKGVGRGGNPEKRGENLDVSLKQSRLIPKYTLHDGMHLTGGVLETSLIGKVPIRGTLRGAFGFTGLVGKENLAAMGFKMPELKGIRFRGTAIGQYGLSCVKGEINALTFIFEDETISTTRAEENQPLGLLTTKEGRPCIPGIKVGNLREFIADRFLLGALQGAGDAAAATTSTRTFSAETGLATQIVTDDSLEFIGGRALSEGSEDIERLLDDLLDDTVVGVYVSNDVPVGVMLQEQIHIDYDPEGRKLRHESLKDVKTHARLD